MLLEHVAQACARAHTHTHRLCCMASCSRPGPNAGQHQLGIRLPSWQCVRVDLLFTTLCSTCSSSSAVACSVKLRGWTAAFGHLLKPHYQQWRNKMMHISKTGGLFQLQHGGDNTIYAEPLGPKLSNALWTHLWRPSVKLYEMHAVHRHNYTEFQQCYTDCASMTCPNCRQI